MKIKTEIELVELLKVGDENAFVQIFNLYFESLCLFSQCITKNHEVTQDIVEDIFLQLWTNCTINPIEVSVKSYLYRCAYNNSIKYISRLRKNTVSVENLDQSDFKSIEFQLATPDYPIANLITKELEEKATEIIESLPEQCRKIYLLNRDEDLKYTEIADQLNISVSTVKTQMSRAFAKLRENLKEYLYLFC